MRRQSTALLLTMAFSLTMLLGATDDENKGCGGGLDNRQGEPGIDVGGKAGATWDVSYSPTMEVKVVKGGAAVATQNIAVATGGTFELGGVTIDLAKLCARPDVACPQEVFPAQVRMTQPGNELHLLYITYNKEGPLKDATDTLLLGNVDSDWDFSIALGVQGATAGACGLLAVSYATGKIVPDAKIVPKGKSLTGKIITAYHGACVASGSSGAAVAGLTVELSIPFSAVRK